MSTHDIIDNHKIKLVDKINRILDSTNKARFAVGYFFLSGFTPLAEKLSKTKEIRLLIGNTTNRETLEQMAEGYRRLELISDVIEKESYPKRTQSKQMAHETGDNIREGFCLGIQDKGNTEVLADKIWEIVEQWGHLKKILLGYN